MLSWNSPSHLPTFLPFFTTRCAANESGLVAALRLLLRKTRSAHNDRPLSKTAAPSMIEMGADPHFDPGRRERKDCHRAPTWRSTACFRPAGGDALGRCDDRRASRRAACGLALGHRPGIAEHGLAVRSTSSGRKIPYAGQSTICRRPRAWLCSWIAASIPIRSSTCSSPAPRCRPCWRRSPTATAWAFRSWGRLSISARPRPRHVCGQLSALREEDARRLPESAARRFSQLKPFKWDDLATPREVLKQLAKQNGIELANLELVPHDLWAAADLPPLSLADRLTLVAIQFDLTFSISADGTVVSLAPLPERVAVVRNYPGGADPAATARSFARLAPAAEIKVARGRVFVRGLVEDQERIARPHHADSPSKPPAHEGLSNKRFTLTVTKKPVGTLLGQLAKQLNLELEIDQPALDRAGISLDRLVSFSVKEATADELFRAAARPAGLAVHRHGSTVEVAPAE